MAELDLATVVAAEYGTDTAEALALLLSYGTESWEREPDRVRRAVIVLSGGDLGRLRHYLARAKRDYRNVLMWAEYTPAKDEPSTHAELRERPHLPPDPEHPVG